MPRLSCKTQLKDNKDLDQGYGMAVAVAVTMVWPWEMG